MSHAVVSKKQFFIVAFAIILTVIASLVVHQSKANADDKGPYLVESMRFPSDADLQTNFNKLAKDGWVYVSSIQANDRMVLVFKTK